MGDCLLLSLAESWTKPRLSLLGYSKTPVERPLGTEEGKTWGKAWGVPRCEEGGVLAPCPGLFFSRWSLLGSALPGRAKGSVFCELQPADKSLSHPATSLGTLKGTYPQTTTHYDFLRTV